MNISKNVNFAEKKKLLVSKVLPHLMRPETYPMPRVSLEDCVVLMSKDESSVQTRAALYRVEQTALCKLKESLIKNGISRVIDAI